MTTVGAHAEIIRRRLFAGSQGRYNFLSGAHTDSVTTLTLVDSLTGVVAGTKIAVDSEIMLVRPTPDAAAKTVPVLRGFLGTTAVAHSDQALVEIAPRFPLADIVDTMKEEVDSWGDSLFRVAEANFSSISDLRAYDLDGAVTPLFLLEVVQENSTWTQAENSRSSVPSELIRGVDATDFPSGFAIQMKRRPQVGVPVRVKWAEAMDTSTWTTATDLQTDVGVDTSWLDIIVFGVLWRLMAFKEVGRTDIQSSGETRKATEIPPGYLAKSADDYMKLRDRRLADEALQLRSAYPYRSI